MAGLLFLGLGFGLDYFGIYPNVKRIWTPSWVLFSGGWCFLLLAGFYSLLDAVGWERWAFPLRVIGANSIVAYCMAELWGGFIASAFRTHLVENVFKRPAVENLIQPWGDVYAPLIMGIAQLITFWLILFWMYRRKILVRI